MQLDYTIKIADLVIAFATLAGPIFAVQAQRFIDGLRQMGDLRERVFQNLMSTRATPVATRHVEALNAIPIAFYPKHLFLGKLRPSKRKQLESILEVWRTLLNHFSVNTANQTPAQAERWEERRKEFEVKLLGEIGVFLGYQFPSLDIETQIYFPVGHGNALSDEEAIRSGLARILRGQSHFPITVQVQPQDQGAAAAARE